MIAIPATSIKTGVKKQRQVQQQLDVCDYLSFWLIASSMTIIYGTTTYATQFLVFHWYHLLLVWSAKITCRLLTWAE